MSEIKGLTRRFGDRFVTSGRVAVSDRNSGAPALSVHRLSKRFGDRVAFQDISLSPSVIPRRPACDRRSRY
jgi:hypothetical protein